MTIVDNNVLSSLAKIERLHLLPELFETVGTPTAVVAELDRARTDGRGFVERIDAVKSYNDGWLRVVSPTESELELADDVRDHALSTTDAQCLAITATRDRRLVTDDAHVGTIGTQRDVTVWDLTLCLQAAVTIGAIETPESLAEIVDGLRREDGYRFTAEDEAAIFDQF